MFTYSKLLGRMTEKGYTQGMLARSLGISENAFTNKIKGRSSFNSNEIAVICQKLDISNSEIGDIFFVVKV